jgi:hypothetical protein
LAERFLRKQQEEHIIIDVEDVDAGYDLRI